MPKLVFHACNSEYVPVETAKIVSALQENGFISDKWQSPESVSGERYLIGESFLSLVTFLGCAPAIEICPSDTNPESTEFCHVEIEPVRDTVEFIRGSDHLVSRCPHCRQRHANWKSIPDSLSYSCDKCGVETHLSEYDWKNTAGCGRFFINLHGIYPQEAIPTSSLLVSLENITGSKWNYFYIQ